ncbi:MAG: DegT/DnrJ/EryC1/StrS family aminotransferase [Candidatus Omnitrophica bacterium]|nr:DegT/DnrJ/EryC1/StrS family aminotransferase [Candidatus Omnitrophota bacterium]MCG2705111.1 DegT/DnrJ/EryC1/StrS family aminotransferase [Candidatus Omnitrophota bacterium]
MITMFKPYVSEKVAPALTEILKTSWIGQGPHVDKVEEKFEKMFDTFGALTLNSCTSALHLALILSDLGEGDEVITTPMTCSATNMPILYEKARPVFADIQKSSLNIDPKDIKKKLTSKTKAIMVVHWGGEPCDMDEILAIAKEAKVPVIEDAAHALGAKYKAKYIGAVSDFTCFSFQAIKQITTVDGGILTCKDDAHYKRGKLLRWYGIDRDFKGDIYWKFKVEEAGFKYHMNDVTATMLSIQLDDLEKVNSRRREIVKRYREALKDVKGLTLLEKKPDRESGNWLFTTLVERRDDFTKMLKASDIETHMVHVRCDVYPIFGGKRLDLPAMNEVEPKYVSIPLHQGLTDDDVDKVVKTIKKGW